MPPKVGITWNDEADRKILLAILRDQNASNNIDWNALAAELSTESNVCTVSALKKHISRLRISVNKGDEGNSSEGPTTPAKSSLAPDVPAPKGKAKAKATPRKRAVPVDSDDEENARPINRKKSAIKTESDSIVKSEAVDSGDDDKGSNII